MTSARSAIGNYCFKKSCSYILSKCNWLSIENMIIFSGIKFVYKILSKMEPNSILKLYKQNKNQRKVTKWYTVYLPKTVLMKKFHIYRSIEYFYLLPKEIQNSKTTTFKKKLKLHLSTHTVPFDSND